MGRSDGTVRGIAKILDNGPNESRYNIVLVAEGFTDAEQDDFNDACVKFVNRLQAEPWFPVLGGVINIHRLNVSSNESGADDPLTCNDGTSGSGRNVRTYFDASTCAFGTRRNCVEGDYGLVADTLDTHLPEWHFASVLVNKTRGGCASGRINWVGFAVPTWDEVMLHELGHSIAGLGDEYSFSSRYIEQDKAPPINDFLLPYNISNSSSGTDRAALKWKHFVTPEIPIPTMRNADCTQVDTRPNILHDDLKIGSFEGADQYRCGRYRPAYRCRMHTHTQPFCGVCIEAIANSLSTFNPMPLLEVVPSDLDFGEIPHGMIMYRGLEIRNRRVEWPTRMLVTLSPISGEFNYAPGTHMTFTLPAPTLESYTSRTIFVSFSSRSTDGQDSSRSGSLTVTNTIFRTGRVANPHTVVNLQARTVQPKPVDSVLVIDRSGSMSGATGVPGRVKIDHAIDAAKLYVSLLRNNDRVGLVRYNHRSARPQDVIMDLQVAGDPDPSIASGRANALAQLSTVNFNPDGYTSIGAGILLGGDLLDSAVAESRAIIVLTDGRQNTDPDIPTGTTVVAGKTPRQRVFAVGLGLNQLEDKLHEIATVTNGVALITGELVGYKEFLLQKLYVQILADVTDEAFVTDPTSILLPGQSRAATVYLSEVDVAADFIIVFRRSPIFPKYMNVWLEAPDGTIVNPNDTDTNPNVKFVRYPGHLYFRCQFPTFPDRPQAHIGPWKVWIENSPPRIKRDPLYYSVMCKARSNFRLGGHIIQSNHMPGSAMTVVLEPSLYGQPATLDSPVRVQVIRPDDVAWSIVLEQGESGLYRADFNDTQHVGPYQVIATVSATSGLGYPITRYRHMTGIIFLPGYRPNMVVWRY